MSYQKKIKTVLVTGSAGFIGYHVSLRILNEGWRVIGLDCMSDYYDVSLKQRREAILRKSANYCSVRAKLEDAGALLSLFEKEKPEIVIHLAAQAGVRYSIENPRAYLESNIVGTFELLEAARVYPPKHMMLASTSSAYGASEEMPYREIDKADHQMSFYAATKKSTENMAHSYAHLFDLPITMFRFFTVYGPWGRPDMALFKFTKAILGDLPIDVYNYGNMTRAFTYIDDIINSIRLLVDVIPPLTQISTNLNAKADSLSPVAPFRVVNIGNANAVKLVDFIGSIERALDKTAKINFLPMQDGDVPATWADVSLLTSLTGYEPELTLDEGVARFVEWYRSDYVVA